MSPIGKGPRIGVVGSCQVTGMAAWIRLLLPGADVRSWPVTTGALGPLEPIHAGLADVDVIITQVEPTSPYAEFAEAALPSPAGGVVFMPVFVFAGFQPDSVPCLAVKTQRYLDGPIGGNLHSAVILAAWRLGLPPTQAAALFNTMVFEQSGYFDVFDASRAAMLAKYDSVGFDLTEPFQAWLGYGDFMYGPNHPDIAVLGVLARLALARAGLAFVEPAGTPADDLAAASVWATHAPIARRHGVPQRAFLKSLNEIEPGTGREWRLIDVVRGFYAVYDRYERDELTSVPRTDTTQAALEQLLA